MKTLALILLTALSAHAADKPERLAKVSAEMAAAANAFLESLAEPQRAKASFPFDSDERENWHFVPKNRVGIPLADLTAEQRELVTNLLGSGMSAQGVLKVETIIALESLLAEMENNPAFRDAGKYHTSIFGEPTPDGTWSWRFEGHHLSVNFTLADGKTISATPSFLGASPAEVRGEKMKGTRPLAAEEDLARTLATALHDAGKAVVFSDRAPNDILTGADRKARQLDPVGVLSSEFTEAQKEGLLLLIAEYANRHRKEIAGKDMEKIKTDFGNIRFGWAGSLQKGEAYYYRVQGRTFLIEASNIQNNANHIHTVWRDLEGDFARDVLGEHHKHHDHAH